MAHLVQLNPSHAKILEQAHNNMNLDTENFIANKSAFQAKHPKVNFDELDDLRQREYARLDKLGHIYVDYTGGGLYAQSQLKDHMQLLLTGVYGNPHSANPTSMAMTELDEQARAYVLNFFNADPDEYLVIFTQNASGALRIVGESYPFETHGQYLLTFDNHNSVNGIREFAKAAGAPVTYSPVMPPDLRLDERMLMQNLERAIPDGNNLFAFPAQSNFSGVQHSLKWIDIAHDKGWDVLLDSAAFAPTNRLDLSVIKPDYVPLSFYKIFGYPTGVGALIARQEALKKLHRRWFAGGTITVASVQGNTHFMNDGVAAFEDGTIDYLNLPAIENGIKHIEQVGIDCIHQRVTALIGYLIDELTQLHHDNGAPLIRVYGPINTIERGGTVALNFYDPNGIIFDYRIVEAIANQFNISLRTGCFCNPGASELAANIPEEKAKACFEDTERMTFEQYAMAMISQGVTDAMGAVRISVGVATNFKDVYQLVQFMKSFLNMPSEGIRITEG